MIEEKFKEIAKEMNIPLTDAKIKLAGYTIHIEIDGKRLEPRRIKQEDIADYANDEDVQRVIDDVIFETLKPFKRD